MPQHATVFGNDDDHTAALLAKHMQNHPGTPVIAVFEDDAVADLWLGVDEVGAVAWAPALVRTVLAAFPPHPREYVSPPPVIVGESRLADRLADDIVTTWSDPTHAVTPHRIQAASSATQAEGPLGWSDLRPAAVVEQILGIVDQWQAPPERRGTLTGPTVYVAGGPESAAVATGHAVATEVQGSRVVVLLSGDTPWPAPGNVEVVTVAQTRASLAEVAGPRDLPPHPHHQVTHLARLLFEDAAWLAAPDAEATAPAASLLPTGPYADGSSQSWATQPESVTTPWLRIATETPALLEAAGFSVAPKSRRLPQPLILDPDKLAILATGVLRHLKIERTPDTWQTALEFASQLPLLAARSGYAIGRPPEDQPLLTTDLVERLAPQVHLAYQGISKETDNASGSPLALALWEELTPFQKASNRATIVGCAVAHAVVGLRWKRTEQANPLRLEDYPDLLKQLGELEHRRWAINERRHGRPDHEWAKPWDQLGEVQRYDIEIMRMMPYILADANIEVWNAGAPCP